MADDHCWIYRLTARDLEELGAALATTEQNMADLRGITPATFPLPSLSRKLAALQRDIVEGRGFILIKGIPIEKYDRFEAAALYWGIGQHFGTPVSQNADGHLLGHVKNRGYAHDDSRWRAYQTKEGLRYHTDSCEIVGLFCQQPAKTGRLSSIASAGTVHNAIRDSRPDLLETLYRPYPISRVG